MVTTQRKTYDDLMALPNDENLHELVRGEILCMPPPKGQHGATEAALVGGDLLPGFSVSLAELFE